MLNVNELRAAIARKGYTQKDLAYKMLGIDRPDIIFFAE